MNYWGRIFFNYNEASRLSAVKGQPLENHVGNTRRILEAFRPDYFHTQTRPKLMIAAGQHDDGKKETFRIMDQYEKEKKKTTKRATPPITRFSYSFSGHRFKIQGNDPYIDALIRSHHEFSVEQINRERARISKEERTVFADDLYLLCMADQLEAELAVKTVEEKKGELPRTFMEFSTHAVDGTTGAFTVVPWPFAASQISLDLRLKIPPLPESEKITARQIQTIFEHGSQFSDQTHVITLRRS